MENLKKLRQYVVENYSRAIFIDDSREMKNFERCYDYMLDYLETLPDVLQGAPLTKAISEMSEGDLVAIRKRDGIESLGIVDKMRPNEWLIQPLPAQYIKTKPVKKSELIPIHKMNNPETVIGSRVKLGYVKLISNETKNNGTIYDPMLHYAFYYGGFNVIGFRKKEGTNIPGAPRSRFIICEPVSMQPFHRFEEIGKPDAKAAEAIVNSGLDGLIRDVLESNRIMCRLGETQIPHELVERSLYVRELTYEFYLKESSSSHQKSS